MGDGTFRKRTSQLLRKFQTTIRWHIYIFQQYQIFLVKHPIFKVSTGQIRYFADYDHLDAVNHGYLDNHRNFSEFGVGYGEWDMQFIEIEKSLRDKSLQSFFNDELAWTETKYYRKLRNNKIDMKNSWNRMNLTAEEIGPYYKTFYQKVKMGGEDAPNSPSNPIKIFVCRDGNCAVRDGNHRLAVARAAGCPYIYARIVGRHHLWIQKVKSVANTNFAMGVERRLIES